MFGIVQPCRHSLSPALRRQWWGHLCGLCLGLRDGHGQAARATTNVDAVALSVLVEAQRVGSVDTRRAGPCPLRGFRSTTVVRADDPGIAHAVAVSLTMAATKLDDHVADGDGWVSRVPLAPRALAGRWARAGDVAAAAVGFDAGRLRARHEPATWRRLRSGSTPAGCGPQWPSRSVASVSRAGRSPVRRAYRGGSRPCVPAHRLADVCDCCDCGC